MCRDVGPMDTQAGHRTSVPRFQPSFSLAASLNLSEASLDGLVCTAADIESQEPGFTSPHPLSMRLTYAGSANIHTIHRQEYGIAKAGTSTLSCTIGFVWIRLDFCVCVRPVTDSRFARVSVLPNSSKNFDYAYQSIENGVYRDVQCSSSLDKKILNKEQKRKQKGGRKELI